MSNRIRFSLILLFLVLGIALQIQLGIGEAWYLYAGCGVLLVMYILFGNVWAAFTQMRKGNLVKAEVLLYETYYPKLLLPTHRAYYALTKGMILLKKKRVEESTPLLEEALQLGLRNDSDRSLASLNLAHIYYAKRDFQQSKEYLAQTKALESNDLIVRQQVEQLERAFEAMK